VRQNQQKALRHIGTGPANENGRSPAKAALTISIHARREIDRIASSLALAIENQSRRKSTSVTTLASQVALLSQ
jgi:hypothetical protein